MQGSYWAFGAILLSAVLATLVWYNQKSSSFQSDALDASSGNTLPIAAALECGELGTTFTQFVCAIERSGKSHAVLHREADLRAQQEMALATGVLMFAGVAGFLTSLLGLALVYENLKAMRKQSEIQKRVGENQLKAYLWVADASFSLPLGGAAGALGGFNRQGATVSLTLVNDGQTPALNISPKAELRVQGALANAFGGLAPKYVGEQKFENRQDSLMPGEKQDTYLFFEYNRMTNAFAFEPNALAAAMSDTINAEQLIVVGTVSYQDVFGQTYFTEFEFSAPINKLGTFEEMQRERSGKRMFEPIDGAEDVPEVSVIGLVNPGTKT